MSDINIDIMLKQLGYRDYNSGGRGGRQKEKEVPVKDCLTSYKPESI